MQVLRVLLMRLRYKTQRWEANPKVGRSCVSNTFPRAYLNSGSKIKGPSLKGYYIHGS